MNKYLSRATTELKNRIIQTIRQHRDKLTDNQIEYIKNMEDKDKRLRVVFLLDIIRLVSYKLIRDKILRFAKNS
jgi:hypothetical protein